MVWRISSSINLTGAIRSTARFCREFNLCMAELSERDDVRTVLISARGRLFSVGGDLVALAASGDKLPQTVKIWTSDLHHAIVRMVRMRAPVVMRCRAMSPAEASR